MLTKPKSSEKGRKKLQKELKEKEIKEKLVVEESKKTEEDLKKKLKKSEKDREKAEKQLKKEKKQKPPFLKRVKSSYAKLQKVFGKGPLDKQEKEEKKKRIEMIAEEIANLYPYNMIIAAQDNKPQGSPVHGFLQRNYEDYKDLVRKDFIFDRAAFHAQKQNVSTPMLILTGKISLKDLKKTVIELKTKQRFDHEPNLPYKEVVAYAPEYLDTAIDWKKGVKKRIEAVEAPVTLGYFNIGVMDWALFNIPMVLVLHAPGKNWVIWNPIIDPKELQEEKELIYRAKIAKLEYDLKLEREQTGKIQNESKGWRREYTFASNKLQILSELKAKEETMSYVKKGSNKKTWENVLLFLVLIGAIIVLMFVMSNSAGVF